MLILAFVEVKIVRLPLKIVVLVLIFEHLYILFYIFTGACIGIFFGGYILKRLQLRPKGAVQLVIFFNILCLSCYAMLFFFGCENIKMAGTTMPYFTR